MFGSESDGILGVSGQSRVSCSETLVVAVQLTPSLSMMHVGLGRAHPLHIEYVHLGVCLAFIQDILSEAILSHPRLSLQRKIALVKAIGKVIWIQNDLMAKWHVKDGEEFDAEKEETVIEEEGYLHGMKVVEDDEGGGGDFEGTSNETEGGAAEKGAKPSSPSSIPVRTGTCPFSGS